MNLIKQMKIKIRPNIGPLTKGGLFVVKRIK